MLEMRDGGGATTGGNVPRPGGGGGSRDAGPEGAGPMPRPEGAVTPSSVRFPSSGRPAAGGGGGGTLRAPFGGWTDGAFFPRPSKMSRSDPLFSFCAMARVSCMCRPPKATTEATAATWSFAPSVMRYASAVANRSPRSATRMRSVEGILRLTVTRVSAACERQEHGGGRAFTGSPGPAACKNTVHVSPEGAATPGWARSAYR